MNERSQIMMAHLGELRAIFHFPRPRPFKPLSLKDAERISDIEKTVNHDVQAIREFMIQKLPVQTRPYLLYGLGSEDINSIALGRLVSRSRDEVIIPELVHVLKGVTSAALKEKNTTMIARTHGLPAGVTTFGKELANSVLRLCDEIELFRHQKLQAKLSGEVGTFHSLVRVGKHVDWQRFADQFIQSQGLEPTEGATQVVPYDSFIRFFHSLFRINTILIDLSKNMWLYVLLGYLTVHKVSREVGSSGMPHKVNPIYFEGAEGGLIIANGIIETMARALMVNRLSRDFSDSTIRRNTSIIFGYSLLSYQSLVTAFERVAANRQAIEEDIAVHAEVWIEPMKLVMLGNGIDNAYDLLKGKTRGRTFTTGELHTLIDTLPVDATVKKTLHDIPFTKNPYPAAVVKKATARVQALAR